ncbi:MAG: FkbM family methyltransferase [Spirochaetia bacterium]|nr:FkbM family methyltransferase [Spirochaetia bacterium]
MTFLRSFATRAAKSVFTSLGLKVRRMPARQIRSEFDWLKKLNIRTFLDVGANSGQSVRLFRDMFPKAHIHSFEPLADLAENIRAQFAGDSRLTVHQTALGAKKETASIQRSAYSQSSSLLEMNPLHRRHFPHTSKTHRETIDVQTLDDLWPTLGAKKEVLLKIDVQGFEKFVLQGARRSLRHIRIIIVEVSLIPLYRGEAMAEEIHRSLLKEGFHYAGSFDQLLSPIDGEILQQDAIYIKRAGKR